MDAIGNVRGYRNSRFRRVDSSSPPWFAGVPKGIRRRVSSALPSASFSRIRSPYASSDLPITMGYFANGPRPRGVYTCSVAGGRLRAFAVPVSE